MPLCVEDLPQLLQSYHPSHKLLNPFVCFKDALIAGFIHLPAEVVQELSVGNLSFVIVTFEQELYLLLSQEDFAALEPPSEVLLIKYAQMLGVEAVQDLMEETHPVDSPLGEQMLDFLFEGKLVDHLVLYDGLVELLFGGRGAQDQP